MKQFTEKYVRKNGQWVKIIRNNKDRTFTFARGYNHNFAAHDIETIKFKWIANWNDAIDHANRKIEIYSN